MTTASKPPAHGPTLRRRLSLIAAAAWQGRAIRAGLLSAIAPARWSIAARVAAIVVALAVPLNVVIVAAVWYLAAAAEQAQRVSLLYSARSVAAGVDAQLGKYLALAQALSSSPYLFDDDLASFELEARSAFSPIPDAWILVSGIDGRQLMNSARPPGTPLPHRAPAAFAAQQRAFETRSIVISDVLLGAVRQDWSVNVEVPVFRNGQPFRALSVTMSVRSALRLLNAQDMPPSWLSSIVGRDGRYIARVPDHDAHVGRVSSEGWPKLDKPDGLHDIVAPAGDRMVIANAHSTVSDWTIGFAVTEAELQAATWRTIRWGAIPALGVSALSIVLAVVMARRVTRAIDELRDKAAAVLEGTPASFHPTSPEVQQLWDALQRAAEERNRSEAARRRSDEFLVEASRLSEFGRMAAALAHELNQPLASVVSYIGGCRRILRADEFDETRKRKAREAMESANAQAMRAGDIIRRMREFIGTGERERRIEDADRLMREACTLAITSARYDGISVRSEIRPSGRILVDKVQFQQVIINLARNAVEAMENSQRKELGFGLARNGSHIEVTVSDTGPGIHPDMVDQLFTPFTTTKSGGMGIGLSVCREIVEAHEGKIWSEANPDGGTVFRFTLPIVAEYMVA